MKTLLLWGLRSSISEEVAYQLSLDGHRLLLSGEDAAQLEELDLALCQNELHRFTAVTPPRDVAHWVSEQHVGLDGVVLFPPEPEPTASLLVPLTVNSRNVTRTVLEPIELVREVLPQLRRGKRPKRILVLLPWNTPDGARSASLATTLDAWRSALPWLCRELDRDRVVLNVLFAAPDCPELPSPPDEGPPTSLGSAAASDEQELRRISPSETARFAAAWFSPALAPLSGHFLEHPRRFSSGRDSG